MRAAGNHPQAGVLVAAVLLAGIVPTTVSGKAPNRLEARGRAVLTRLCADCHAVGRSGRSPHLLAPAFRTIGQRYDIDSLIDNLREGFTAPHPDMPTFSLTPADARAVQAYLKAIQQ